jgi:ABC-2 type transport system ATP-binding protein
VTVIQVRGLTKRFGPVLAVDQLSFDVARGAVTGFLGPNGAGKTTTLRMLLGLVEPTGGSATINGRRYRDLPDPLRQVGAVLEASNFHPGRTARSHLRVQALAGRIGPARLRRRWSWSGSPTPPTAGSAGSRSACASALAWPPRCSATPRC